MIRVTRKDLTKTALAMAGLVLLAGAASGEEPKQSSPSGGIYDRPYITRIGSGAAIGGYAEFNSNFEREDGISEGFSLENRRFNVFLFSSISEAVRFTSELEFEHGTEEIAVETALVDLLISPAFNLRGGILLSPIGRFNIAHDSPRYNVIDRPLVSTRIIPSTLSEPGLGAFGTLYPSFLDRLTWESYIVNGLGDGVVGGSGEGTRIAEGKGEEVFEEDNNGSPAFTGRLALNPRPGGELGFSVYTGRYNTYKIEGLEVDEPRGVTILALDAEFERGKLHLRGEGAVAMIDVPKDHIDDDFLADRQSGLYVEANYTFLTRPWLGLEKTSFIAFTRYDGIDLNMGSFDSTSEDIGETTKRITTGLAFRPTPDTVFRLSYFREWQDDSFNNRVNLMNVQFGVATYF